MKLKNWLLTTFIGLAMFSFAASVVPQVKTFKVFDDGVFISRLLELNCAGDLACTENLATGKIDLTVTPGLTGSGTTGKVPLWTAPTVLGDSIITESGGVIIVDGVIASDADSGQIVLDGDEPSGFTGTISFPTKTSAQLFTFPDASGTVSFGTGTADKVTKWSALNTTTDSTITDDGSIVTFNISLGDIDFVVNSDLVASAFVVDAGTDAAAFNVPLTVNNILFETDSTHDIGTVTVRASHIYTDDITIGGASLGFSADGSAADVFLGRDGADILALNDTATPAVQEFRIYNADFVDASNYERLSISVEATQTQIRVQSAGSGTATNTLRVGTAGTGQTQLLTNNTNRWAVNGSAGHFFPGSNNSYDIGTSGLSPRVLFMADKLQHGGDTNTSFEFTPDVMTFRLGGVRLLVLDETNAPVGIKFNPDSADADFIVNTDTVASAFILDAGLDTAAFNVPLTVNNILFNDATNQIVLDADEGSGFTGTITLASLAAARTYTFPDASGTICTSGGGCGSLITGSGTTNTVPKWTSSSNLGDSSITDTGSLITLGDDLDLGGLTADLISFIGTVDTDILFIATASTRLIGVNDSAADIAGGALNLEGGDGGACSGCEEGAPGGGTINIFGGDGGAGTAGIAAGPGAGVLLQGGVGGTDNGGGGAQGGGITLRPGAGTGSANNGSVNIGSTNGFQISFNTGGALRWTMNDSGDWIPSTDGAFDIGTTTVRVGHIYTDDITITGASLGLSADGSAADTFLKRDAADTLAQRNSTTAQEFRIYETFTDASNYERLQINMGSNVAQLVTASAGTGSTLTFQIGNIQTGDLLFLTGGVQRWQIDGPTGDFIPGLDSTYDIGTAVTRPASIFGDQINATQFAMAAAGGGPADILLERDAANVLAQRNSTTAQNFRLYRTFTNASNYERLNIGLSGVTFQVVTEGAGTGASRDLNIGTLGSSNLVLLTANLAKWRVFSTGHLVPFADNTYDIGTSTVGPRIVFVADSIQHANNTSTKMSFGGNLIQLQVSTVNAELTTSAFRVNPNNAAGMDFTVDTDVINDAFFIDAGAETAAFTIPLTTNDIFFETDSTHDIGTVTVRAQHIYTDDITIGGASLGLSDTGLAADVFLKRDAADILAQRNGTADQSFHIYKTFTDASNYERLEILGAGTFGAPTIRTAQAGTGSSRTISIETTGTGSIFFQTNSTTRWAINGSTGDLILGADSVYDIGSQTARPAEVWVDDLVLQELGWSFAGSAADTFLIRQASGVLEMRNGTTAQEIRLFRTFTTFSNYERLNINGTSGAFFEIMSEAGSGGGTDRQLRIGTRGSQTLFFVTTDVLRWSINNSGTLSPQSDSAVDIGSTGVRPATIWADDMKARQVSTANVADTLGAAATVIALTSDVETITGDAGTNTIATITGGDDGSVIKLIFTDALVTITDDGTHTADTVDLDSAFISADNVVLTLVRDGTSWYEVGRSVAGAAGVSGSGTTDTLPKWTAATTLGDSNVTDDGTTVTVGTLTEIPTAGALDFVIENVTGSSGMTIFSGNAGIGNIFFGDTDANVRGAIQYRHSTDAMNFLTSTIDRWIINPSGHWTVGADSTYDIGTVTTRVRHIYTDDITIGGASLGLSDTGLAADVFLKRDFSDQFGIRNSTAAQRVHIYETFTDFSNYERFEIRTGGNLVRLQTDSAGTGAGLNMIIGTVDAGQTRLQTNNTVRWFVDGATGDLAPNADNTYDIGSDALSVDNIYVQGNVFADFFADIGAPTSRMVMSPGQIVLDVDGIRGWELLNSTQDVFFVNPTGVDLDFIVETDTETSAFFVNAGTDSAEFNIPLQVNEITYAFDSTFDIGAAAFRPNEIFADEMIAENLNLSAAGASADVTLARDSGSILALRRGTGSQEFRIYETFTDASNYERLEFNMGFNLADIKTRSAGTGSAIEMKIGTVSATSLSFLTSDTDRWLFDSAGTFRPTADSTYTLGVQTLRPSQIFVDDLIAEGVSFSAAGAAADVFFVREAANILGLQNSTTSQEFNVFNTFISTGNQERIQIGFDSNVAVVMSQSTGAGVSREIRYGTKGASTVNFLTSNVNKWRIDGGAGHFFPGAGDTYDIGFGSFVVRNITMAGNLNTSSGTISTTNFPVTLGAAATTFVITSNVTTLTGDAGSNTLATVTGATSGTVMEMIFVDALITVTDDDSHAADTIDLDSAFTSADDVVLTLVYDGTSWYETGRSAAGAAGVGGSGTTDTIPKWTAGTTLGDSSITDDGSTVTFSTNLALNADGTLDLGTTTVRLNEIFTDAITITGASLKLSADGSAGDVILARDGANILAQRNVTAAQTFNLYRTFTDASNYERLNITGTADFTIETEQAGTGTARNLVLGTTGATSIQFKTNNTTRWIMNSSGNIFPNTTATLDIGTTNNYPDDLFVGDHIEHGGDPDTLIDFNTNEIDFFAGAGGEVMQINATGVRINQGSGAVNDFRINGDTVGDIMFVDVSLDRVSISGQFLINNAAFIGSSNTDLIAIDGVINTNVNFAAASSRTLSRLQAADETSAAALSFLGGIGGDSAGGGTGGVGGALTISAGTGGDGDATFAAGVGGLLTISGGSAGADGGGGGGAGNNLNLQGGNGSGAGADGSINLGGSQTTTIRFGTGGTSTRWEVQSDGDLVPGADATYDLGATSRSVALAFIDRILVGHDVESGSGVGDIVMVNNTGSLMGTNNAGSGAILIAQINTSDEVLLAAGGDNMRVSAGTTFFDNNVDLGSTAADSISFLGDVDTSITLNADNSSDIGTSTVGLRDIFMNGKIAVPNAAGTSITMGSTLIDFDLSTVSVLGLSAFTGAIFNETGESAFDLRVETNNITDALFIDSGAETAEWNVPQGHGNTAVALGAAAVTFSADTNFVTVTGDGGANTIATITSGTVGEKLTLLFVDGLVTVTDDNSHAANSVDLSAAFTSADDTTLELIFDGTSWYEVSRSTN